MVATTRQQLAACVLALLLGSVYACRMPHVFSHSHAQLAGADACSTCKFAVSLLSDALCDPYVDNTMVQWLVANVCTQMDDKAQCRDIVRGVTPALVEWLRANANPESMCGSVGVCGGGPLSTLLHRAPIALKAQPQHELRASRPNDMTCPLCMFVAAKVKEQINDPATQADIRSASLAACAQLPAGVMQDACGSFVDQYEMMYVKYLADMEPQEVCMVIGTCMDPALSRLLGSGSSSSNAGAATATVARPPALQLSPRLLAHFGRVKAVFDAAQVRRPASSNSDHCETCKVVVQELHQVVANPDLQAQVVDYAKQACTVFPSYQATCQADVDQYAPMAFGMALAYLQPEQVCVQLKMCPPPSLFSVASIFAARSSSSSSSSVVLGTKFAAWSIITTSSDGAPAVTGGGGSTVAVVLSGSDDEGVVDEDAADDASSAAAAAVDEHSDSMHAHHTKVHGPGLVLPMAS